MVKSTRKRSEQIGAEMSMWIDITIPLRDNMVRGPGVSPTRITRIKDVDKGDPVTMSEMTLISHTGTHIDAPLHFFKGGKSIDDMPLDAFIGPARVIEIKDTTSIKVDEIFPYNIRKGERILFKTLNSDRVYKTDDFVDDYVYISTEAAHFLADIGIGVVGIDYISVGTFKSKENIADTHRAFLGNDIWVIEGINLAGVAAGNYELICLPIKLEHGDASLARAILRPI
jgi:arylformamidase